MFVIPATKINCAHTKKKQPKQNQKQKKTKQKAPKTKQKPRPFLKVQGTRGVLTEREIIQ